MVLYEVNLKINKNIFPEFMAWLKPHINEMLQFDGFTHAKLLQQTDHQDETTTAITVVYEVTSQAELETYFKHHAKAMRDDGIQHFGDQFTATRRILEVL